MGNETLRKRIFVKELGGDVIRKKQRTAPFAMGDPVLVVRSGRAGDPGTVVALIPNGGGPRYRVVFEDGSEAELPPDSLVRR